MNFYSKKNCRRYGIKLSNSPKDPVVKRNYPPGVHGPKGRGRVSGYGQQLAEKQKAKILYNLREKQFKLTFEKSAKFEGGADVNFLKLLEMRLDNVVYRLGWANTRPGARQIVNHAHIRVNGQKVNIPSYEVQSGDIISIKDKSKNNKYFKETLANLNPKEIPGWLNYDSKKIEAKVLHAPKEDEVEQSIDTTTIVEFYSK